MKKLNYSKKEIIITIIVLVAAQELRVNLFKM